MQDEQAASIPFDQFNNVSILLKQLLDEVQRTEFSNTSTRVPTSVFHDRPRLHRDERDQLENEAYFFMPTRMRLLAALVELGHSFHAASTLCLSIRTLVRRMGTCALVPTRAG